MVILEQINHFLNSSIANVECFDFKEYRMDDIKCTQYLFKLYIKNDLCIEDVKFRMRAEFIDHLNWVAAKNDFLLRGVSGCNFEFFKICKIPGK